MYIRYDYTLPELRNTVSEQRSVCYDNQ